MDQTNIQIKNKNADQSKEMIVKGPQADPAITCGNGNKEDCTTNELPVPDEFVKPLHDAGHKDYHDLKLNTTSKTPKRI